jgi:hypothetical protein
MVRTWCLDRFALTSLHAVDRMEIMVADWWWWWRARMVERARRPEADAMLLLIVDRMLTFCGHYWSKLGHLRLPFAFALFPSHVVSFISYMLL